MEPIMVLVGMVCLMAIGFLAGVEYQRGNTPPVRDSGDRNALVLANALCEALDQADREKAKLYKQGILDERERCAKIAEGQATMFVPRPFLGPPPRADDVTRAVHEIARMIRDQPVKDRPDPRAQDTWPGVEQVRLIRSESVKAERERCLAIVKAARDRWKEKWHQLLYRPGIMVSNPAAEESACAMVDTLNECVKLIEGK